MAAVENNDICAVICAGAVNDFSWLGEEASTCKSIICADAGYLHAEKSGITPDAVIGDFDSSSRPEGLKVVEYPVRKDYTDASLAISYGVSLGFKSFRVYGATVGSRLDHTIANIVMCAEFLKQGIEVRLVDEKNEAFVLLPGSYSINKNSGKLSLFAFGGTVSGLCESGVSYPLNNYTLEADNPLGVSNEIVASKADISFLSGILLIILSKD